MEEALSLSSQKASVVLIGDEAYMPHMVTFEQPDGSSVSLNYRDLREVRYDPAGAVWLRFAAARVVISGRNLLALWRDLRSRRVQLLRACIEAERLMRADHEPHIDSIAITPAPRRDR